MAQPRHVRVGQPMKATWANDVVDALHELGGDGSGALQVNHSSGGTDITDVRPSGFFLADLKDDIFETNGTNKQAYRLVYNDSSPSTPYYEHAANNDYLNLVQDPLAFDSSEVGGVYLGGERHALYASPESGYLVPVPGLLMQVGKVKTSPITAGGSGTVTIYSISGSTWTTTGHDVTAYDPRTTGNSLAVGHRVAVWLHRQSAQWIISDLDPCAS